MRVAVIGGGYAGMAAAVTLADAGVPVTLYEASPHLGGRARRVVVNDVALDNGLHILLGAYTETLRLMRTVDCDPAASLVRLPLDWQVHRRFRLKAAPLPSPLHLAIGVLAARGASWRERLAAVKFVRAMRAQRYRLRHDVTVRALLAAHGQGPTFVRYMWEPLCLAALNTPPRIASAQVFLNVMRDGLDAAREAADMLVARVDLSALLPDPAARYVRSRGGSIATGCRIDGIEPHANALHVKTRSAGDASYDHVICAVPPARAAALVSALPALADTRTVLESFRYQPIHSVYLQFADGVALPAPMLGFDGTAHWLFDRQALCGQRGLIAAVISGEGDHQRLSQPDLAQRVHDELERELGPFPALAWHRVIAEKQATFECAVGVVRPHTRTALPNLHLAGDYTASDYPATLESAVRSGVAAANQVLQPQL